MTERKPPGMSFTSWVDQQIAAAEERGAFDDLPGTGKPLPATALSGDVQAWVRDKLRREGESTEALLPTPLKLRKEIERLPETVAGLRTEDEVREVAAEINHRIVEWRRFPDGPPIHLRLVNADELVAVWRESRVSWPAPPVAGPEVPSPRRRWWRRALVGPRVRPRARLAGGRAWPGRAPPRSRSWGKGCQPGRRLVTSHRPGSRCHSGAGRALCDS
jgi:hypothetical protein